MKAITRSAIVEHAAAQMYALVDDIEAYPRFLPWCLEARVQQSGAHKRATLSAGPVHMALSTSEGPAPETWRYNLHDGQHNRAAYGRVTGKAGHMDVLRYAAGICAAGY